MTERIRTACMLGCFASLLVLGCGAVNSGDTDDFEEAGLNEIGLSGHKSNNLLPNQTLNLNTYLQSANGSHRLYMQSDGNLVVRRMSDKKTLWASGTDGKSVARLKFQNDGNLVLRTDAGVAVWSSKTAGSSATKLVLKNSGQLVLYRKSTAVWSATGANTTDVTIGIQKTTVKWVDHFYDTSYEVTTLRNGVTVFNASTSNMGLGPEAAFSKNISVFSSNIGGHYKLSYHNGTSVLDIPDDSGYSELSPFVSGTQMVWTHVGQVKYYDTATPSVPVKTIPFGGSWNSLEQPQVHGSNFVSVGVVNDYFPNGGGKVLLSNGVKSKTLDSFFSNLDPYPSLYGNRVAWSAKTDTNADSDAEIMLYDIGTGTKKQLTENAVNDERPSVSDAIIAWISGETNVYAYKGQDGPAQRIARDYSFSRVTGLKVFNDKAVWEATVGSGPSHVYFYDGTAVTVLSTADADHSFRLSSISANTVVYTGSQGVYAYNIASKTTQLAHATAIEVSMLSVH